MNPKNEKAVGANQTACKKYLRSNYNNNRARNLIYFDRNLLPTPAKYYSQQFGKLHIKSEWVKVRCPFHDDHEPSLNINMVFGGYRCFACGAHGGNVLAFQIQRYKQNFRQAAIELGAWRTSNGQ